MRSGLAGGPCGRCESARSRARGVAFHLQRASNIGAGSSAWVSTVSTLGQDYVLEDRFERKRVLLGQRNDDAVVGGRGLQFEVERETEALAQRETPTRD